MIWCSSPRVREHYSAHQLSPERRCSFWNSSSLNSWALFLHHQLFFQDLFRKTNSSTPLLACPSLYFGWCGKTRLSDLHLLSFPPFWIECKFGFQVCFPWTDMLCQTAIRDKIKSTEMAGESWSHMTHGGKATHTKASGKQTPSWLSCYVHIYEVWIKFSWSMQANDCLSKINSVAGLLSI